MNKPELVVIRTYLNKAEAEIAHGALEAAQVRSMIGADDAGGTGPELWMSGVKLLVRTEDVARAEKILSAAK
jgi:Putative prokaryotic signal transducing protein